MDTREAIARRIRELCRQRQIDLILMDVQAETGKAAFPLRRGSSGNTRKSKSSL